MTSLNPEFQTQFDQGRKPQHVVYQFCLAFFLSIKIITINQKRLIYMKAITLMRFVIEPLYLECCGASVPAGHDQR